MALGTTTKVDAFVWGNKRVRIYDVVLTSGANYTTGGETILPATVGLKKILQVVGAGAVRATSGGATARTVDYDLTNNKLQVYTTGSAEAGSSSDQSAFTARLTFIGY
jgi:hypothetical protein